MKLSVIIPVYNAAPYLNACLESVGRNITDGDTEVIAVDDGSTDGSRTLLREFAKSRPWLRTIELNHNCGVSAARNKALEAATGEWIGFVDADDTVAPDWFAKLLAHAEDGVDIVHADRDYCLHGRGGCTSGSYRTFLRDGWPFLNLVRRSAVGATRFKIGMRLKEDVVFFTEIALRTARVAWVNERGYGYRLHEGSAVAVTVRDADALRFADEIRRLGLPREDAGRALGYDLVMWMRGREQDATYDPAKSPVLKLWRDGIASGALKTGDVRWWWRPALRHWLASGDVVWFAAMVNDQDADTMQTELKSCSVNVFDLKQSMPRKFGALTLCAD